MNPIYESFAQLMNAIIRKRHWQKKKLPPIRFVPKVREIERQRQQTIMRAHQRKWNLIKRAGNQNVFGCYLTLYTYKKWRL